MAVSCSEVMYGAYYPYLYGRGAARSFHHAPHFQYTDRLNVQSGGGNGVSEAYGGGGGGGGAVSSGSTSSGAGSPPHAHLAPHARLRAKEEELSAHSRHSADAAASSESDGECAGAGGAGSACAAGSRARAQYVSANCVVFTHYSGDVAAVVDEHFARALAIDKPKESVPMVSRNLPASFFNAAAVGCGGGGACGGGVGVGVGGSGAEVYEYDPWHQHYGGYAGPAAQYAHAHQHMAAAAGSYSSLLLGRGAAAHALQYKPVEWGAHHSHAAHAHLDPAVCAPYYPPVPGRPLYQTGLEAQVQDTSKDLYWF